MNKRILAALIGLLLLLVLMPISTGAEEVDNSTEENKTVCAYYFYNTGCYACELVEPSLEELENKYDFFELKKYEIRYNKENRNMLARFYKDCGVEDGGTPTIIIRDKCLIGVSTIVNNLEDEILANKEEGLACPVPGEEVPTVGIVALLGAAAADAVNPCALAVLTLLLVTIVTVGTKRKALFAGLAFTLAVYISYLLMGFGIFGIFSKIAGLSFWFKKGLGILAIVVGLLNIKDYVRPRGLGFAMEVPLSWRPRMKAFVRGVTSVPGAFVVGMIVSLFLLPCTSGPYIVICGMLASCATFWDAVPLLLLYNLVFVLPMLGITALVYFGMKPEAAAKWRTARVRYLHLIAGIIMLALGVLLLIGVL